MNNSKLFCNKIDNESGSVAIVLIGLIFSLTFSAMVISFLLLQFYGVNVAYITPASDSGVLSSFQDYKRNLISDDVNYISQKGGTWTFVPDVGRVLSGAGGTFGLTSPCIVLSGVTPIGDEYVVNYMINNSVNAEYGVFVRWSRNSEDTLIFVKSDGFHIPKTMAIFGGEFAFYPYPNPLQDEKVHIKTVFNEGAGTLQFYYNEKLIFTHTGINRQYVIPYTTSYYAGVTSDTNDFTVEGIDAGAISLEETSILKQISAFIIILAKILVWNVDSAYLPFELNLIFIKTQLFGIIVCAIMIIRGVG